MNALCVGSSGPSMAHTLPPRVGDSDSSGHKEDGKKKKEQKGQAKGKNKKKKGDAEDEDEEYFDPFHDHGNEDGDDDDDDDADLAGGAGGASDGVKKRPSGKGKTPKPKRTSSAKKGTTTRKRARVMDDDSCLHASQTGKLLFNYIFQPQCSLQSLLAYLRIVQLMTQCQMNFHSSRILRGSNLAAKS